MLLRLAINDQPKHEPHKTERSDPDECTAPAPPHADPCNHDRPAHGSNIGHGVKKSSLQRAFFLREPFGYCLDAGGKNCCLAETESESEEREAREGTPQGGSHRSQAPENHCQGVTHPGAKPVNKPANYQHAQRISGLENNYKIPVVDFIPAQIVLQRYPEDSKYVAIHIVLGSAEEQQPADHPAEISRAGRNVWRNLFTGRRSRALRLRRQYARCGGGLRWVHCVKGKLLVFAASFQSGKSLVESGLHTGIQIPLRKTSFYQLCIVPSSLRLIGK